MLYTTKYEEIIICSLLVFLVFLLCVLPCKKKNSCLYFYCIALNYTIIYLVLYGLSCMQGKQGNNEEEKLGRKIICCVYLCAHVM